MSSISTRQSARPDSTIRSGDPFGRARRTRATSPAGPSAAGRALGCPRWLLLGMVLLSGCAGEQLINKYGEVRGEIGKQSVNGTAVLADMFSRAGCRVRRWSRMSPRIDRADVIVWIPDSFKPPSAQHRRFVDDWLQGDRGRTLVYVGRDYDASMIYWEKLFERAKGRSDPSTRHFESKRRIAQRDHETERDAFDGEAYGGWFIANQGEQRQKSEKLAGPWSSNIQSAEVDMEIWTRFDSPRADQLPPGADDELVPHSEDLLTVNGEAMIRRIKYDHWDDSQVILVTNGSFLLNLPLVNHEHRKLAARLIQHVVHRDPARKNENVVFMVSSGDGPKVYETEPRMFGESGFGAFVSWPLGAILIHLFGWGLIYCAWRFPIFGRPRERQRELTADFGKHVTALGRQLQRTGDMQYAQEKLEQYHRINRP